MFLFIINQTAGNKKGMNYWRTMENELIHRKIPFQVILSDSKNATDHLIDHFISRYTVQAIVVLGGDGTIHSVLQKAIKYNLPLAIFPTGSGNDTARMFNLTNRPKVFVQRLLRSRKKTIDVLQVNEHFGMTVAGVGIDAMIGKTVNESFYKSLFGKLRLGSIAYLIAVFQSAIHFKSFQSTLIIDGKKEHFNRTWLIATGNTSSYGGGLKICPQAEPDDGQMNVTIFHTLPKLFALLRIFPTLLRGKTVNKRGVFYRICKQLTIETERPIDVMLDGELISQTPLTIQIRENALQLIQT